MQTQPLFSVSRSANRGGFCSVSAWPVWLLSLSLALGWPAEAEDAYEAAPIHYSQTPSRDMTRQLQQALDSGKLKVDRSSSWSALHGLLKGFGIAQATQVMVFSKTSKQNDLISPATPRVIYFNDDAYVGYSVGGSAEVAAIDPVLGPVFYLVDLHAEKTKPLRFERDQSCLSCHGGPFSPDVPGVLVRSVTPNADGHPLTSQGSRVVDTTTPFEERWGGWYVTGKHGRLKHRGNVTAEEDGESVRFDLEAGQNVTDLGRFFDTSRYPRATSDVVALMVLEHQTGVQNALTKANHATLRAMHMQRSLQKELGEPVLDEPTGTAKRIIDNAAEDVLDALLFKDEAALPEGGIEGDAAFLAAFTAKPEHCVKGRSLKDLQMLTRLFKYRCSYMIHSLTFRTLQPQLKAVVLTRLRAVLKGCDADQERYSYLSESERGHISEILRGTKVL